MLLRRAIAAALALVGTGASLRGVSGRVFLDTNRNGRCDAGEHGMGDVGITDGVGFVRTRPDGRYEITPRLHELLQPDKEPILTVSFPSGTWPVGGWFRRVSRERPSGDIDFPLRRDAQKLPFLFVHGTDAHVPHAGKEKFLGFRNEMGQMAGRVTFCVLTGDNVHLCDHRSLERVKSQYDVLAEMMKGFPLPLFSIPGNHDPAGVNTLVGWDRSHPMYGYGFYWEVVGPLRWSFNYAGVHFVGIDYMHKIGPKWVWGVPRSAVAWLREDLKLLKPGSRVLLFVHYPQGGKELKALLREHGVEHIFSGHRHCVSEGTYAGIPFTLSGSLSYIILQRGQRPGYRFVRVTSSGLETLYKPTGAEVAVTVNSPRRSGLLRPGQKIRGSFFDPEGRIRTVIVKVGRAEAEVSVRRAAVFSSFEARVDLTELRTGLHKVVAEVSDGSTAWRCEQSCLVGIRKRSAAAPATRAVR
jgi:hypothetical protein